MAPTGNSPIPKPSGPGFRINILNVLDLKTQHARPSAEEMVRLRREDPLLAALYLIEAGKRDEAEPLLRLAQEHIREQLEEVLQQRHKLELQDLNTQLAAAKAARAVDQNELTNLRKLKQSLSPEPYGRAVLVEAWSVQRPLTDQDVEGESQAGKSDETVTTYRAIIAAGNTRYEVNIASDTPVIDINSLRGRQVWTAGKAMNVVKIGEIFPTGTTAEVVKRIDDQLLHVKRRSDEEFVVQMTPKLSAVEDLKAGDLVRILPDAELGLDLLESGAKRLTLDEIPTERYENIGGMDDQIKEIKRAVELPFLYRTVYQQYHLKRPKGILLYGPPGCGKTMVARAIARSLYEQTERALRELGVILILWQTLRDGQDLSECLSTAPAQVSAEFGQLDTFGWPSDLLIDSAGSLEQARETTTLWLTARQILTENAAAELRRVRNRLREGPGSYFFSIKGPELLSKWVGESEYSIRRIFAAAREKATQETPVVLFFDEMESMFSRRGSGRSGDMEKTIVPQLLAEIDGVDTIPNVLVIGASNRYDLIDPAVLRPGRLDVKIRIDRPSRVAARDILNKYLTIALPIDEREVSKAGSKELAITVLITRTLDVIYSPRSQVSIYRQTPKNMRTQSRENYVKALTEIVSGAMLANLVERAKRAAAERAVAKTGTGINWQDDLRPAIKQECEESKDQYIFEARSDFGEMSYRDADEFVAEVRLAGDAEHARPIARWVAAKTRPWTDMPDA